MYRRERAKLTPLTHIAERAYYFFQIYPAGFSIAADPENPALVIYISGIYISLSSQIFSVSISVIISKDNGSSLERSSSEHSAAGRGLAGRVGCCSLYSICYCWLLAPGAENITEPSKRREWRGISD